MIEFQRGLTGYLWFFPRKGAASAGIATLRGACSKQNLWKRLDRFLAKRCSNPDLSGATRYGGCGPSVKMGSFGKYPIAGDGWALIGDAAGFSDPVSGEGIYHAFKSAGLLAEAIISGRPEAYGEMAGQALIPDMASSSRAFNRFYSPWFVNLALFLVSRSAFGQKVAAKYLAGEWNLSRVKRETMARLPTLLSEAFLGRQT